MKGEITTLEVFQRLFGRETASKDIAKERLRLVLVHDRSNISPETWEALKEDLIRVISHYMEIDESTMEVDLQREHDAVALVASIPVRRLKRSFAGRSAQ